MNRYRNTLRTLQSAVRTTLGAASVRRSRNDAPRAAFESMESRRLMAATAVKSVDTGGPDEQMINVGGTTYVVSSAASGSGNSLIYATKGPPDTAKKLVDVSSGNTIWSFDDLTGTADGRVYFTATGGTGGGRQLFQVNTAKGGYTQITKDTQAFYTDVIVVNNKVFLYDSTHERIVTVNSNNTTSTVVATEIVNWYQAKGQLFYSKGDEGLFRTDGTAGGTYKISGNLIVGHKDIFVSNDWLYFEGSADNNTSLYRSSGANVAPIKIADDFSLLNNRSAELGEYVYFSGGYYNTSPNGGDGQQLIRVRSSTGAVEVISQHEGGQVDGIYASGTNIYYTADDGDYINSIGWSDRELYRYDTVAGVNTLITTGEQLYPVDDQSDGGGAGVLGTYYFTASPTKDEARYGVRKVYRTNPSTDAIEEVAGLPALDENEAEVWGWLAGPGGLFITAEIPGPGFDTDTFFIPTPYSYIDPVSKVLIVEATDTADTMTVRFDDDEVIMNLNGIEERQRLADFTTIRVGLKQGDDNFKADASVTRDLYVTGDSGNDQITGGSGNDNLLGGAGKNKIWGMAGNDRLRGSNGPDYLDGGDGADRLYGYAGSDQLFGGNGVDVLYGDDENGQQNGDSLYGGSSNDRLYGRAGDDLLVGGKQNDYLYGGDGNDTLQGQDGNDWLYGEAGADVLYGDAGDDHFGDEKDGARDLLDGGAGTDTILARDDDEAGYRLIEVVG